MTASSAAPAGNQVALLDLVAIKSGQVDPRTSAYRDLPLIAPDHLASGTGRLLKKETAAAQGAISGKYLVRPGDVIYSKIRPYLQKAYKCDFEALCSADMYPLSPRPGVDASFILHTILGRDFTNFATSVSARSGIPKINRAELSEYKMVVPPSLEQKAIGRALDDIDDLIAALELLVAKRQAVKHGMMQELLTGRIRLPGFDGPWQDGHAEDVGTFKGGSGFPVRFQGAKVGEVPFFKVSDMSNETNELFMQVSNNYISQAQRKQLGAVLVPANAIVFAKVGAAVFQERKRILAQPSCIDNNMAAYVLDPSRANVRFVHHALTNFPLGSLVATGALPSLNGRQLRSIPLTIPTDLDEQCEIASALGDVDEELKILRSRIVKCGDVKEAMMQQLLTGRTRLPVEAAL